MSRQKFLRVRNFDLLQHYKDRNPIWIKLYCSILEDYDFALLPDETKFHAIGLMLLASRSNNKFPADEVWLRAKINAKSEINLKLLLEIRFLECVSSENSCKNGKNSGAKNRVIGCKPNKTQGDLASTLSESVHQTNENGASAEQKREEENRTHTQQKRGAVAPREENGAAVRVNSKNLSQNGNGHHSKFSLEDCFAYVRMCESKGEPVKNAKGLANHLFKTGEADAFILATLYPEENRKKEIEIYGEPVKFTDLPCEVCFGSKMEIVEGRGARPCPNCKNEKGNSTGLKKKADE